ncbi:TRAP transporter small permease [Loktanella sp. SALINAS62]|uniref:TRAP transporter small permease n=1 Tax=Loktanella sp. SALINAS62 TaxID=2706124 RepID=UPI001B8C4D48|nr:TRAP transporter small permease [Loktanella sp. SALINAS62]MBS1301586.1 TRAP transporter small permease [Loktanella sp. SALINAS62]
MSGHYQPKGPVGAFVNTLEEGIIAFLLGAMTLLTFTNVILRYGFNSSIIWSLEVVLTMFAWLVLFGIAYGFKVTAHLGVDAITNLLPPRPRKIVAMIAALLCVFYGVLLLKGCYDYWAPFADLPPTSGRWFPTGFDTSVRSASFFETDQIPMLSWLRFLEDWVNYGERYSKMPRLIPYTMLPIAGGLILFRIVQATVRIWRNDAASLIVSHEAEDAVAEAALLNRDT